MAIAQQVQELWPELEWVENEDICEATFKQDSYLANKSGRVA
mgnify:CR=1 FL=1|jgi:hypothetical protein